GALCGDRPAGAGLCVHRACGDAGRDARRTREKSVSPWRRGVAGRSKAPQGMSLWGLLDQNGMLSLNSTPSDLLPAASIRDHGTWWSASYYQLYRLVSDVGPELGYFGTR